MVAPKEEASTTWVDRMRMVPLNSQSAPMTSKVVDTLTKECEFNIISFNILAEGYLTPRSHPGLPESYANVAFDTNKRRQLLLDTLERFCCKSDINGSNSAQDKRDNDTKMDIIALQELDLLNDDDGILPAFEQWGYQVVRTTSKQRKDCCAIAFDKSKFTLEKHEIIQFDDLATLENIDGNFYCIDNNTNKREDTKTSNKRSSNSKQQQQQPELTGMVRSFLRRNCAVLAHLKCKETNQSLIVTSVHLYWNPSHEYVKMCQAKYLLDRVAAFASSTEEQVNDNTTQQRIPTCICGDMNSKPGSIVHQLFVKSHVDARTVAPWRYFWDKDNEVMYTEDDDEKIKELEEKDTGSDISDLYNRLHKKKSKDKVGGYIMNGFDAEFTMYCGVIDNTCNNVQSTESKSDVVQQSTENNSDIESGISLDVSKGITNMKIEENGTPDKTSDDIIGNFDDLKANLERRRLQNHKTPQDYDHSTTQPMSVKYVLDYTLNRFTRWLRILGVDATLETLEEEKERTSGGRIALFDHCKDEQRTLITTSKNLLLRKDCPPGAYLIDPKSTSHLEKALILLLRTHGVELSPRTFLTRCVVCNGHIKRLYSDEEKVAVFVEQGGPRRSIEAVKENTEVFRCDTCGQGYWWDDAPSSSGSRVFSQATKLFRLCLQAGVGLKDEDVSDEKKRTAAMGAFSFVDVAKERQNEDSILNNSNELVVVEWLREKQLNNPFILRSAYAKIGAVNGESLPFTNVTKEFVGGLDYIFFEPSNFEQVCKLNVPTTFRQMNSSGLNQGHLIPSDIWPSDHIAVGARLRLRSNEKEINKTVPANSSSSDTNNGTSKTSLPPKHDLKCGCGCVPNILSLFEMAELRKKRREELKAAKEAAKQKKAALMQSY